MSLSLSYFFFFFFPWQIMLSLDNLKNVQDTLCAKSFSRSRFSYSLSCIHRNESLAYKEKNVLGIFGLLPFQASRAYFCLDVPGDEPASMLLAHYGHVCDFNGMISTFRFLVCIRFEKGRFGHSEEIDSQKLILKPTYSLYSL